MVNGSSSDKIAKYHARERSLTCEVPAKLNPKENEEIEQERPGTSSLKRSQGKSNGKTDVTANQQEATVDLVYRVYAQKDNELYADFEHTDLKQIKISDPLGLKIANRFQHVRVLESSKLPSEGLDRYPCSFFTIQGFYTKYQFLLPPTFLLRRISMCYYVL